MSILCKSWIKTNIKFEQIQQNLILFFEKSIDKIEYSDIIIRVLAR